MPDSDANAGLYPIDVLDPSLYVPLHVVYYYHNLIWFLKKHKFEPGKMLFGFGYDFRQSNMIHVEALLARLEEASKAANGAKCAPPVVLLRSAMVCSSSHKVLHVRLWQRVLAASTESVRRTHHILLTPGMLHIYMLMAEPSAHDPRHLLQGRRYHALHGRPCHA